MDFTIDQQLFDEQIELRMQDLLDAVKQRILSTGTAADGSKFKAYSTKDFPSYFFTKPATKTGERGTRESTKEQIRKQIKAGDKFMSYADYRQMLGYQTGHKDFMRSGQFMANFNVVERGIDEKGYYSWFGFTLAQFSKEYDGHVRFEAKEIFEPSDGELDMIADLLTEWVIDNMIKDD